VFDVGHEQVSAVLLLYCFFSNVLLLLLLLANSDMRMRALIVLGGRSPYVSCNRAATELQQSCNRAATEHATAALIVLKEVALPDATRFTTATELQQSCNRAATELQQSCNRAATELQQCMSCLTPRHALYFCFYYYCFYCYCFPADLESPVQCSTN
jgi:hypothetical protein